MVEFTCRGFRGEATEDIARREVKMVPSAT
jgi:hypothetical protein